MKIRISYLIPLLVWGLLASCNDELSELQTRTFVKFYGSYKNDLGKDVTALPDGGYALIGNISPDSIVQMALIITDDAGNQVQGSPHTYGGPFRTGGNSMMVLDDGYLLGGTLTDTTADNEFHTDMFLVRTDLQGNEIWSQRYGNEEDDALYHLAERKSNGFVLAGKMTTNEEEDLWILMVDDDGELLYDFKASDADDDDEANFVMRTGNGYLCACTYDEGSMEGTDLFIVSLDDNCNIMDSKALGTEYDDMARSIIHYNGGYLLLGYTENENTGFSEITVYSFEMQGYSIQNAQRITTISEAGANLLAEDMVLNANGHITILGTREFNNNENMYLFMIDGDGNRISEPNQYGELGNQSGSGIDRTPDGGLILIGTNTLEGNSLISLMKTNAHGGL